MSRLYFHTPHDEVAVAGPEAHYLHHFVAQLALSALPTVHHNDQIAERLVPGNYLAAMPRLGVDQVRWHTSVETAFSVGFDQAVFQLDNRQLDSFSLMLNTCLLLGSDPVQLITRIAAQNEIHCFVEGPYRPWAAMLLERARQLRILRPRMGWEAVIELLNARTDEPVVCSYSVTDSFPYMPIDWAERGDDWYDVSNEEQWRICLAEIRDPDRGLELHPDKLADPFRHTLSLFDLFAEPEEIEVLRT